MSFISMRDKLYCLIFTLIFLMLKFARLVFEFFIIHIIKMIAFASRCTGKLRWFNIFSFRLWAVWLLQSPWLLWQTRLLWQILQIWPALLWWLLRQGQLWRQVWCAPYSLPITTVKTWTVWTFKFFKMYIRISFNFISFSFFAFAKILK